ncbi:MAG: cation:proton antiporter [Thermoplasmata archaeon]
MMNIIFEIIHFLILVSVSLLVARIFSSIGKRYFNLPEVVSEIITGIVIGPYALGSISIIGFTLIPETDSGFLAPVSGTIPVPQAFYIFAEIGIILLLFHVGLNTDIEKFVRAMEKSLIISIGETMLPFFLGFLFIYFYTYNVSMALFIGAVLTSSSTGITAKLLYDMGKINSREGIAIMSSTVIVDVISITLIAIITGINTIFSYTSIIFLIIDVIIFWSISLFIGLKLKRYVNKMIFTFKNEITRFSFIMLLLFIFVLISLSLNLTIIVGAYAFGLILSGIEGKENLMTYSQSLRDFFTPIFFVFVGMLVNIHIIYNVLIISLIIFAIAVISKLSGAAIPAWLLNYKKKESIIIGAGLLSMGEIGLILSNDAFLYGIIDNELYSSAIFVTIGTTFLSPILLSWIYSRN